MHFAKIEDALIDSLKKGIPALATVETYTGQLQDDIETLSVTYPAAYVVYGGSTFERVDGPVHMETVEFSVLAAVRYLSSDKAGAGSDDEGVYSFIKAILEVIVNNDLGLGIERIRPVRVSLVFINSTTVVYGLDFETGFDRRFDW